MKSLIFTCLILTTSILMYSQTAFVDAEIILNTNDTIDSKVRVVSNFFDREYVNELSFYKKIFVKPANGRTYKIEESDVKSLIFVDLKGQERFFISDKYVPEIEFNGRLLEEVVKGKITWYRAYVPHLYDRSVMATEFFIVKNKPVESATMRGGIINKLKKLIGEDTEINTLIDNIKTKEDILLVLKKYNNLNK